jgi:hypothetical protein
MYLNKGVDRWRIIDCCIFQYFFLFVPTTKNFKKLNGDSEGAVEHRISMKEKYSGGKTIGHPEPLECSRMSFLPSLKHIFLQIVSFLTTFIIALWP